MYDEKWQGPQALLLASHLNILRLWNGVGRCAMPMLCRAVLLPPKGTVTHCHKDESSSCFQSLPQCCKEVAEGGVKDLPECAPGPPQPPGTKTRLSPQNHSKRGLNPRGLTPHAPIVKI